MDIYYSINFLYYTKTLHLRNVQENYARIYSIAGYCPKKIRFILVSGLYVSLYMCCYTGTLVYPHQTCCTMSSIIWDKIQ